MWMEEGLVGGGGNPPGNRRCGLSMVSENAKTAGDASPAVFGHGGVVMVSGFDGVAPEVLLYGVVRWLLGVPALFSSFHKPALFRARCAVDSSGLGVVAAGDAQA